MAMKRGCEVVHLTFHSHPYLGERSRKKVVDLVRALSRYQPRNRLYVAPFTETQEAIRDHCPGSYRTVLYRRMMNRIASRIARREEAAALITGESMGQVASQTLENITCIGAAADLPVIRPLIAFDKHETVAIARRIGTFELSCVQEPDCCVLFMPARPVIRGRIEVCERAEREIDVEGLVERAVEGAEVVDVEE
jgi:thiamine biosynthesis protein ThiI